ncbi:MAG: phosphatase PAP2 family protein [Microthrixaceae bacterium]
MQESPESRYLALPSRTWANRFAGLGASLLVLGLLLGLLVATQETFMNSRDLPVNTWLRNLGMSTPWLSSLAEGLSWIGSGARTMPLVLITCALLVLFKRWPWALFLLASSQLGFLISNLIKYLVGRDRPPWGEFTARQTGTSFPSGHTYAGIVSWVAIGIVVLYFFPKRWSRVVASVLITIGICIGPSRLILARHWVTDVLGAWLLSAGWLLLCWAVFLWVFADRLTAVHQSQGSIMGKNRSN